MSKLSHRERYAPRNADWRILMLGALVTCLSAPLAAQEATPGTAEKPIRQIAITQQNAVLSPSLENNRITPQVGAPPPAAATPTSYSAAARPQDGQRTGETKTALADPAPDQLAEARPVRKVRTVRREAVARPLRPGDILPRSVRLFPLPVNF